jgi:hypothetical protein
MYGTYGFEKASFILVVDWLRTRRQGFDSRQDFSPASNIEVKMHGAFLPLLIRIHGGRDKLLA